MCFLLCFVSKEERVVGLSMIVCEYFRTIQSHYRSELSLKAGFQTLESSNFSLVPKHFPLCLLTIATTSIIRSVCGFLPLPFSFFTSKFFFAGSPIKTHGAPEPSAAHRHLFTFRSSATPLYDSGKAGKIIFVKAKKSRYI